MPRGVAGLIVLTCIGCASSPQKSAEGGPPQMKEQRITNIGYFDLENCFPRQSPSAIPANKEALTGFLVSARPEIAECLVDPSHRGTERVTQLKIGVNVTDQGPEFQVSGGGVPAAGVDCIRKALQQHGKIEPLAKGAAPVAASIEYHHTAGINPTVVMGTNEASDAVGTVRLALKDWCPCFEPWKTTAPKSLSGKMVLVKATPAASEVTFDPPPDEASGKVQSCLTEKLKALAIPHTSERLEVPLPILTIHSGVDEELKVERPELAFMHLDALRTQRSADVAMALGERTSAVGIYDALVAKYKANPKSVTVKDLKDRCQKLLEADEAWIAAVEKQQRSEERTLAFAKTQQAKEQSWGEVATAAQGQVQASQKELEAARTTRKNDEGACPKVSYKQQ